MKKRFVIEKEYRAGLSPGKVPRSGTWKMFGKFKAALVMCIALASQVQAADLIISDRFNVESDGTGFALEKGVNSGISQLETRMTGSVSGGMRYLQTETDRPASLFDIHGQRLRVKEGGKVSRFTLSSNGRAPYDFGPILRTDHASKANKIVYDVKIGMRNNATSAARCSFGLSTMEGDLHKMDFALQLYRAKPKDNFYTVQKRFDRGSYKTATTPNSEGDLNAVMTTTPVGTAGSMIDFLIRVTDAGAEGAFTFNSRLQVSIDDGATWIYDTASDNDLPNGFRLDGTSRYFLFDQAINMSGDVFYDNFSVTVISQPAE